MDKRYLPKKKNGLNLRLYLSQTIGPMRYAVESNIPKLIHKYGDIWFNRQNGYNNYRLYPYNFQIHGK